MDLEKKIRNIPDFPAKGILFRDITTLLKNPQAFKYVIDNFAQRYQSTPIDMIAGIEARGFILASTLAYKLNKGFIPIRKPGKLPAETISAAYSLEYGTDRIEMHADAVTSGTKVLLVDDLLATGGTMKAACELVERAGGEVIETSFLIELLSLNGRDKLREYNVFSMITFD
jgi:adenine phosphoribosyltransferase